MPPKSVQVEIATLGAIGNYIGLAQLKVSQHTEAMLAALLASAATSDLKPIGSMPSPQLVSQ